MPRINDPENFRGRVAYAAQVIAHGGVNTRAFDSCFEIDDGDEVAVAILRRARKNPKLAANFAKYLDLTLAEECDRRMVDIPTCQLPEAARQSRQRTTARRDE